MNEIHALKKEATELAHCPSIMWGYQMLAVCNLEECCHQNLTMCQHPNTGLPASRTVRNNFLLFISHLVYVILLQQPEHTRSHEKKSFSPDLKNYQEEKKFVTVRNSNNNC